MLAVSIPRFHFVHRFELTEVGVVFRCASCSRAVLLRYGIRSRSNVIHLTEEYQQITPTLEPFEMQYLSGAVLEDFTEALTCYSTSSWNAFASMCRRCIQSVGAALGTEGTSKVQAQMQDLKARGVADNETFDQLHQVMLAGHDGAHPHVPALSAARATILLQLMKDVLYQLFVRPAKIREAGELRKQASTS